MYDPLDPASFSIIFGTIHLPISHIDIITKVYECIDRYDKVYTETTLDQDIQQYITPYITLLNLNEWSKRYSNRSLARLKTIIKRAYGIELTHVMHLRPMIIMGLVYGSLQKDESEKLDHAIWSYAQSKDKTLRGIETIQQQVAIMKNIPLNYDFDALKKWMRNVPAMNKKFYKLIELYYKEDILQLYKNSISSMGALKQLLIYDRNLYMSERIIELHEQQPSFFCFGAGHLAGSKGVLKLIKNKKYKVDRI